MLLPSCNTYLEAGGPGFMPTQMVVVSPLALEAQARRAVEITEPPARGAHPFRKP